jgi:hypothetical protein
MTPARRRSLIRLGIVMVIYVASLVAAKHLVVGKVVSGPLAYALAVIPGLAVAGMFYNTGRMIIETEDEFMRMLAVRQQMVAAGFALSVAAVWGFLEQFGLVSHVEAYWVVVLWAVGVFIGQVANRIIFGTWGECP